MIKLDRKCYMILDLDTGEVLSPYIHRNGYWHRFKAIYDSKHGVNGGLHQLKGHDKQFGCGEKNYKIVEVVGVEVVDDDK